MLSYTEIWNIMVESIKGKIREKLNKTVKNIEPYLETLEKTVVCIQEKRFSVYKSVFLCEKENVKEFAEKL